MDRSVIPSANSVLQFKRRFRYFYYDSHLYAQISADDGASWATLLDRPGDNDGNDSFSDSWHLESVPIPGSFVGRQFVFVF